MCSGLGGGEEKVEGTPTIPFTRRHFKRCKIYSTYLKGKKKPIFVLNFFLITNLGRLSNMLRSLAHGGQRLRSQLRRPAAKAAPRDGSAAQKLSFPAGLGPGVDLPGIRQGTTQRAP